eukprot:TRINITY_DN925_c0_g1_i1.p1 TRINITY_DN925_c0_g1~~TRINITY_DN925_c0_g1_i1.p1  ORF type:complete len:350 (-),score=69.59 TRINITY_DN925_c0_g1_i1:43-996(-)
MGARPPAKRAVLVGCTYPRHGKIHLVETLDGPANDAKALHFLLTTYLGFQTGDVSVLIDSDDKHVHPTGKNIMAALVEMCKDARPGDTLVFAFSGHGTRVPDVLSRRIDERDGFDEAIVPTDFDLILDDDIQSLARALPDGVNFYILTDSCHSGGMLDIEHSISETSAKYEPPAGLIDVAKKNRFADPDHLGQAFGAFHGRPGTTLDKLRSELSRKQAEHQAKKEKRANMGILFSACQSRQLSSETSYAGVATEQRVLPMGVLTAALLSVFEDDTGAPSFTNRVLLGKLREKIQQMHESQIPTLHTSEKNADRPFLR